MTFVTLIPVILSALMLAAHFSRAGNFVGIIASVAVLILLAIRKKWVARALQVLLVAGGFVWINTAWTIAKFRYAAGQPFGRMLIILGIVALFTIASALVFETKRLRRFYQ